MRGSRFVLGLSALSLTACPAPRSSGGTGSSAATAATAAASASSAPVARASSSASAAPVALAGEAVLALEAVAGVPAGFEPLRAENVARLRRAFLAGERMRAVSVQSGRLAVCSSAGVTLQTWDPLPESELGRSGTTRTIAAHVPAADCTAVRFTGDGRRYTALTPRSVVRFDATSGAPQDTTEVVTPAPLAQFAQDRSGNVVVVSSGAALRRLRWGGEGPRVAPLPDADAVVQSVTLTDDGTRASVFMEGRRCALLDVENNTVLAHAEGDQRSGGRCTITRDGARWAVAVAADNVRVWNARDGVEGAAVHPTAGRCTDPVCRYVIDDLGFDANGRLVAALGLRAPDYKGLVRVWRERGSVLEITPGDGDVVRVVGFRARTTRLVALWDDLNPYDTTVRLSSTTEADDQENISASPGNTVVETTDDGALLATVFVEASVWVRGPRRDTYGWPWTVYNATNHDRSVDGAPLTPAWGAALARFTRRYQSMRDVYQSRELERDAALRAYEWRVRGARKSVSELSWSPDGRFGAAQLYGGNMGLWDAEAHASVDGFGTPPSNSTGTFTEDGRYLIARSESHGSMVWDLRRGARVSPALETAALSAGSLDVSSDGARAVAVDRGAERLRVLDGAGDAGVRERSVPLPPRPVFVALSPSRRNAVVRAQGPRSAAAPMDEPPAQLVSVVDLEGGSTARTFAPGIDHVASVCAQDDGAMVFVARDDATLAGFRTDEDRDAWTVRLPESISSLVSSPDGSIVAAQLRSGAVVLFAASTGAALVRVSAESVLPFRGLAFHPSGRFLLVGYEGTALALGVPTS